MVELTCAASAAPNACQLADNFPLSKALANAISALRIPDWTSLRLAEISNVFLRDAVAKEGVGSLRLGESSNVFLALPVFLEDLLLALIRTVTENDDGHSSCGFCGPELLRPGGGGGRDLGGKRSSGVPGSTRGARSEAFEASRRLHFLPCGRPS